MRLTTRARRRAGFTLIEMLVVIAIIVLLIGLSSAALMKTVERQNYARTREQITKLQTALNSELGEVNKKARAAELPSALIEYCEGDEKRARAVLVAMYQRQQFPTTFDEARTSSYIVYGSDGNLHLRVGGLNTGDVYPAQFELKPLAVYTSGTTGVQGLTAPGSLNEQSGVLLYIALTQKSNSGGAMGTSGDDLTNSTRVDIQFGGQKREAFADGFKFAIGFRRWEPDPEAQGADYVDQKLRHKDPLDPTPHVVGNWNLPAASYKRGEMAQLGFSAGTTSSSYRLASVYSFGKDKVASADDVHGFRILKIGNTGYKP
jgi:prepilin-type N-terminal cleavage/methylation domain-containing protein